MVVTNVYLANKLTGSNPAYDPFPSHPLSMTSHLDITHFASEDDYHRGCRKVSHCYLQSYQGLHPDDHKVFHFLRPSPFFLCLVSFNQPKFLAFSKKSSEVVKPFFTWNNSFNLKNEHSNSIEENRNKNRNIFLQYIVHFVNPNMWMLTFNVVLRYQGLLFWDFFWFFLFSFFFQSNQPTQYQGMHSMLNKKKWDGLMKWILGSTHSPIINGLKNIQSSLPPYCP